MTEKDKRMELPKMSLDDLFTIQGERDAKETIVAIPINEIDDFPNHPYKVKDDDKMLEMSENIKRYGVTQPVIVRQKDDGRFEMISGHRRKRASILAGKENIKEIVKKLKDEEAVILMVDSNENQREEILPSEKAFAYKMKYEALKKQGQRTDLTSDPMEQKLTTREIIANENGESASNSQRYIRLTELIPELLEEVDNKRIAFRPAVELSYLSEENQYVVLNKLEYDEVSPSLSQAIVLKKMQQEGTITEEKIEELLDKEKPNQKEFIKIHNEKIDRYIPTKIKETGNVEDFIIMCVQEHNKRERLKQERDAR